MVTTRHKSAGQKARRRGPRHRKDPGFRRSRPSLLRRRRRLRAGTSPVSRAAPTSGSGTACLAASLGIEGRLRWQQDRDKLATAMRQWQDADATHLSVSTMGAGLKTVDDHLAALATTAQAAKTISG